MARKPYTGDYDRDSASIDTVFDTENIPLPMPSNDSSNLGQYSDMWVDPPSSSLPTPSNNDSWWSRLKNDYWNAENNFNNFMDTNPVGKFVSRFGEAGARALTGDAVSNTDTGSSLANGVADVLGTGVGFAEKIPGLDYSTSDIMNKAVGQPVQNTLRNYASKFGLGNKLVDYGIQAAKTGTEFGAYEGLNAASQGKDIGDAIATGMGTGALFGAGGKAVGEAFSHFIPGLGKTKVIADNGNRVKIQDENGNVIDMNKTIFDNTAQPVEQPNINPNKPIQPFIDTLDINRPLENKMSDMGSTSGIPVPNKVMNSKLETPDNQLEIPIPGQENIIRPDFNPESSPTQQIVSSKQKNNFKDIWENFKTHFIDKNSPIKKLNDNSYVKATNSANASGIVDYIMKDGLVDTSGKKVGDSLSKIVGDIPKKQANDFWEYALQRHNIARAAEEKPIYFRNIEGKEVPYTPAESEERVKLLEQQHPEWKQKADNVTNWLDSFMNEWGVKTGTVNQDLYNALRSQYPDYIPTNREFNDLEDFIPSGSGNGKAFVNQTTPIKKATGSERNIINPVENIMNLVNRTVRTAKYNEVGQSVLDAVQKDPVGLSKLSEIIPEEALPKTKTDNIVRVLQNGEPTYLKINNKNLLGALSNINKSKVDDIDNMAKKAINVFKSLITTKNPLFAVSNTVRDLPTYLVNSTENNPLKSLYNLGGAYKDILTKSDSYNQYKGLGGGSENFFNVAKPYKSAKELNKSKLPSLNKAIEGFNNLFETAPRLAEFKDTLSKTGDLNKALYNAGEVTTNFAKGGDYTKKIDNYVPFLNAGVQGLSKIVRQFKDRPIATVLKGATTITAPTLLIDYMNKDNDKYKELDNRTKDNYYLFPYGNEGKFIKLPKTRELGVVFGSLAERAIRQYQGDPQAWKGYLNTLSTNFSPSSPIENNILSPLVYNIPSNKDFADRTIVPQSMQNRSPNLQYDEKTSEIAKTLGNLTNLSPKQIDYVIRSYTGVIGQLLLPAATKSTTTGNKGSDLLSPITSRFTADPLYNNQSLQDFYDNMDKAKTSATDTNFINNIGSKDKTKEKFLNTEYTRANKQLSDLSKDAFDALQKGDMNKVRDIRQNMINIATEANKYMPLPGQDTNQLPMPSSELKSNIDTSLYKKRSDQAKQIRDESKNIYNNYDLSTEEKTQKLQDLLNKSQNAPRKNPPKPRKKRGSTIFDK